MSREWRCEVCGAKRGEPCTNTIDPFAALPGRDEHFARALPSDDAMRRQRQIADNPAVFGPARKVKS